VILKSFALLLGCTVLTWGMGLGLIIKLIEIVITGILISIFSLLFAQTTGI
jgi:hypothetical protein